MPQIFPHLEMHQVFGRIAIRTNNASQEIRQPRAGLTIRQAPAQMTVHSTPATVAIDQSAAWHNLDLKSPRVRIAEAARAGQQAVLDGIARRSTEGRELLHIEKNKGVNLFARQAKEHMAAAVIGTRYSTGDTPASQSVTYQVTPAQFAISWETHDPEIRSAGQPPEYVYHPGSVAVSMQQYPGLEMQAVGLYVDQRG
ncbi:DUF6470 family protein [Sporolactobacillus vineae]|uniref:DUF6470 family protein n=1 Tax=Sporolactobacillus vineae TaxID=444463 RepID=UPI0002886B47|nr:DUF6470 family protein [Sporolactobacillus vineae]